MTRPTPQLISFELTNRLLRIAGRDIGGSDPERMAPPRVEEYVTQLFEGSSIVVEVVSDKATLENEYPLFSAVNRCASGELPVAIFSQIGLISQTINRSRSQEWSAMLVVSSTCAIRDLARSRRPSTLSEKELRTTLADATSRLAELWPECTAISVAQPPSLHL